MPDPREIPQLTNELIDMSREYLRQETIEPAKRLGKHAGLGFGGAALLGLGGIFGVWAVYVALTQILPDGEWWVVLARGITTVVGAILTGIVIWVMQRPPKPSSPTRAKPAAVAVASNGGTKPVETELDDSGGRGR